MTHPLTALFERPTPRTPSPDDVNSLWEYARRQQEEFITCPYKVGEAVTPREGSLFGGLRGLPHVVTRVQTMQADLYAPAYMTPDYGVLTNMFVVFYSPQGPRAPLAVPSWEFEPWKPELLEQMVARRGDAAGSA